MFFVFPVKAQNIIKDSDFDGITDTMVVGEYKTNPFIADTDGDTFSDFIELKYKTDPNNKNSKPAINTNGINVEQGKYYWLFSRASGITAFVLLSIGVCFGMGISSRSAYKILKPPIALEIHNTLNVISLLAVILHFFGFFFCYYF